MLLIFVVQVIVEEHIIVIPDVSTVNLNEVFCNWFLVCFNVIIGC